MRPVASLLILVTAAAHARADGTGIIAISGNGVERAGVARAMRGAIEAGPAPRPRLVDDAVADARAAIAGGAVPTATLERFRRVRERIDDAWRAFMRVEVELSASRLAAARTDAEQLLSLAGGAALYADASLRLGAVLGHLGRTSESQAALALAIALDPDRPITLAEFSPDVVAAVDAVRTLRRPTRAVSISVTPTGAAITVNGGEVGGAPRTVELAHGQHVIVARQPLYESRAIALAVDGTTRDVTLELARDPAWSRLADGARIGLDEPPAQELVDAAIRYADLDEVVIVASTDRRGGPALLVQRCAGLPARCTALVEIGHAERSGLSAAAREAWLTVRTADLRYPPRVFADARASDGAREDGCRVCRSPLLWGGLGAAAVIGAVIVIAVTSGSRPPPVVGVDPNDF